MNYAKERKQRLNSANSIATPREEVARGQQAGKQEKKESRTFCTASWVTTEASTEPVPCKSRKKIWTLKEL